jgi:DNA-binding Xre family transcriptional regulator
MIRDVRRASDAGLEMVERARKRNNWTKHAQAWCDLAFVAQPTLRRFWDRCNILRENFDNICQALNLNPNDICESEINDNFSEEMEIGVLDEEWVGRKPLITDLVAKLQKSHRILLLLGITGIGKTALAESLVVKLRGNWHELRENCENQDRPKDFATVATGWLTSWGERISPDAQSNPEQLLAQVVNKLCIGKYLLLIDSLEYLLVTESNDTWGDFSDRWWGRFFQSLLAAPACNSRIILTSQYFPVRLATECDRYYPNLWHQKVLTGLIAPEQTDLFTKLGFAEDLATEDSRLMLIGSIYDGHPLALRVIAGEIKTDWHSNIRAYWRENNRYIEEVQTALQAARVEGKVEGIKDRWQLASYTVQLRRKVQERISLTFDRLKTQLPVAYELICIASIYRCEVPEFFWMDNLELEGYDLQQQQSAMTALRDRFLVEDGGFNEADERMVSQHNLIRSVAIARRLILAAEKDAHN